MGVSILKYFLHGSVAVWQQIKLCPTSIMAAWQCGSVAANKTSPFLDRGSVAAFSAEKMAQNYEKNIDHGAVFHYIFYLITMMMMTNVR